MKRLEVLGALAVFLGLALALCFNRPEPPDASLFGAEMALSPELAPLVLPGGDLALCGRVTKADGAPADDAFVVLLRSEAEPSPAEPLAHAYTDAGGRFELNGLARGAYRVVLTHPSAPPRTFDLELPATGEVSWELAQPLPALATLPELRRIELSGAVRLPETLGPSAAQDLSGFEVWLRPAHDTLLLTAACERRERTDAAGRFAFPGLVVARYEACVLPPWAAGGTWPVLARQALAAEEGRPEPVVFSAEVGALDGELREAVGRPLIGALIRVGALAAKDAVGEPQLWPTAVTGADGRFTVELLPPGRYLLHQRAGGAMRDVEVEIESGKRTTAPLGTLDPRSSPGPSGG